MVTARGGGTALPTMMPSAHPPPVSMSAMMPGGGGGGMGAASTPPSMMPPHIDQVAAAAVAASAYYQQAMAATAAAQQQQQQQRSHYYPPPLPTGGHGNASGGLASHLSPAAAAGNPESYSFGGSGGGGGRGSMAGGDFQQQQQRPTGGEKFVPPYPSAYQQHPMPNTPPPVFPLINGQVDEMPMQQQQQQQAMSHALPPNALPPTHQQRERPMRKASSQQRGNSRTPLSSPTSSNGNIGGDGGGGGGGNSGRQQQEDEPKSFDAVRRIRLQKNREAARQSRLKHKNYVRGLENENNELQCEVKELKHRLASLKHVRGATGLSSSSASSSQSQSGEEIERLKVIIKDLREELRRAKSQNSASGSGNLDHNSRSPRSSMSSPTSIFDAQQRQQHSVATGARSPSQHTPRSSYRLRSSKSRQASPARLPQRSPEADTDRTANAGADAYGGRPAATAVASNASPKLLLRGSVSSSTSSVGEREGENFGGRVRSIPNASPSTSTSATLIEEDIDIDMERDGGVLRSDQAARRASTDGVTSGRTSSSSRSRQSSLDQRTVPRPNPVRSLSSLLPNIDADGGYESEERGLSGPVTSDGSQRRSERRSFSHSRSSTAEISCSLSQTGSSVFPRLRTNMLQPDVTPPLSSYDMANSGEEMTSVNVLRHNDTNAHRRSEKRQGSEQRRDSSPFSDMRDSSLGRGTEERGNRFPRPAAAGTQTSHSPSEALGMSVGTLASSTNGESVFGNSSLRSLLQIEPPIEFDTDHDMANGGSGGDSSNKSAQRNWSNGSGMNFSSSASSSLGPGTSSTGGADEFWRPRLAAPSASSMLASLPPEPPSSPLRGVGVGVGAGDPEAAAPSSASISPERLRSSRRSSDTQSEPSLGGGGHAAADSSASHSAPSTAATKMEESLLASLCPPAIDPNSPRASAGTAASASVGFSSGAVSVRPKTPKKRTAPAAAARSSQQEHRSTNAASSSRTRAARSHTPRSAARGGGRRRADGSSSSSSDARRGGWESSAPGANMANSSRPALSRASSSAVALTASGRKRKASVSSMSSCDSSRSFFDFDQGKSLHPDLANAVRSRDSDAHALNSGLGTPSRTRGFSDTSQALRGPSMSAHDAYQTLGNGSLTSVSSSQSNKAHFSSAKRLRVSQTFDIPSRAATLASASAAGSFGGASLSLSQQLSLTVTPPPLPSPHSLTQSYHSAPQRGTHQTVTTPRTRAIPVQQRSEHSRSVFRTAADGSRDILGEIGGGGGGGGLNSASASFHMSSHRPRDALSGVMPTNASAEESTSVALPPPMLSGLRRTPHDRLSPEDAFANDIQLRQDQGAAESHPHPQHSHSPSSALSHGHVRSHPHSHPHPFSHTFNQTINVQFGDESNRRSAADPFRGAPGLPAAARGGAGGSHRGGGNAVPMPPSFAGFPPPMSFLAQ